ncbi:GH12 family glycosyl hydrolase domain-containing protein [Streptomyces sp. NBC_00236]
MLTGAPAASAAPVTDCTQWGTTELQGGEYLYQQNEWNSEAEQCVSVDPDTGAWSVTKSSFSLPTNGAPATYPSSYKGCHWGACTTDSGLPLRVDELGSVTTDWSTTQVGSGAYNVSMDIWFNSAPVTDDQPDGTEVMIWMNHRGGVQPIGSRTATVQLDGRTWDVWTGPGASGWKVISYVLQGGATELADFDVLDLIDDGVGRGSINPAHYLIDAEAGFEIWQGGQGLGMNEFAFEASTESGGGGEDTQAPTVPAGVTVTGTTAGSVSLSWTPATDDTGVSGYDVYRDGVKAGSTTSTSFTDTGLAASSSHSYTVRARDAAGNTSAASVAVSATTTAGGGGTTGTLKVQYKNNDSAPGDNQIRPGFQLVNTGSTAVDLSKVSLRYWFSGESGSASYGTSCDYAVIGCGTVTHRVASAGSAPGADHYLEVGFSGGSLAPGASTGEMQLRFNKADWSSFNETDDYSRAANTAFADASKVGVYVNGALTAGTAP